MIEKVKQHLEKHEIIYILILIIFAISCRSFNISELTSNDELWNFSNIYNMTCGFTIYKDINVIITPLFFWIGTLLFKIFGSNYLTFRFYYLDLVLLLCYIFNILIFIKFFH